MSAAVPGLERDMLAFTRETLPHVLRHLDFLNVMAYDMMNRRDAATKHHSGIALASAAVDAYVARGAAPAVLNLGFAFYVKWFKTEHEACEDKIDGPLGCPTLLLEEPDTGVDTGLSGAFAFNDAVPGELMDSFGRAKEHGNYDGDGIAYWDPEANIWWTFDGYDEDRDECFSVRDKFERVVLPKKLGGVFAWGLGEDGPDFRRLEELNRCLTRRQETMERILKDEL